MKKFGRLLTAMVTPFDSCGNIDDELTTRLAKGLLESGSEGLVVSGSTGESPTLNHEEKLQLFHTVKSAAGKHHTVIASTGTYSTANSIALTKDTEKTGVDACLLVVPYYNKPTQEGLYQHFKAIAESTILPCILYNVPSRTVANLNVETTLKLSKIDNIIGIKESSSNFEQIARIADGAGENFLIYSGNDCDTLPILSLGGYGVISVASHLVGLQMKQMIDYFISGKIKEAYEINHHLLPLWSSLFVVSNPMPIKYALNHLGFSVGMPRLPLTDLDQKSKAIIQETLKHYKIDLTTC
jgi:4-hydroxy-tetrahydrodipicolinate synthase